MATGDGGPPARMQDVLTALVRTSVAPTLKDAGLRKRGRATWWEHRPSGGWVLVTLVKGKWNSKHRVQFWGEVACWPPGTWELGCELSGGDATELPFVAANAPIDFDSRVTASGGSSDGWVVDGEADPVAVADDVVGWTEVTLERARAACDDVDVALEELVDRSGGRGWGATYAIAMLRSVAPDHHRLPEIIDLKTRDWAVDPRPIILRPHLVAWRAEAGLPVIDDLPVFWTPAMLPHWVDKFGSAPAAYRALGGRSTFTFSDGTTSEAPPAGWLEAEPAAPVRRWWRRRA
ncbi:MAG: hypothetical protein ACXWDI_10800 [Nocardioides sp.]